jgi:hypothetical protein
MLDKYTDDQWLVRVFEDLQKTKDPITAASLREDENMAYLLAGLGPEYDSFITAMTTKSVALTFDDIYAHFCPMKLVSSNIKRRCVSMLALWPTMLQVVNLQTAIVFIRVAGVLFMAADVLVLLVVTHAKFVASWVTQPSNAGIAMISLINETLHQPRLLQHLPIRLILIGIVTPEQLVI